jgi:hypothetical protein
VTVCGDTKDELGRGNPCGTPGGDTRDGRAALRGFRGTGIIEGSIRSDGGGPGAPDVVAVRVVVSVSSSTFEVQSPIFDI